MTDFELRELWRHLGTKTTDEEVREWRKPPDLWSSIPRRVRIYPEKHPDMQSPLTLRNEKGRGR
jgi:hypothetical protein